MPDRTILKLEVVEQFDTKRSFLTLPRLSYQFRAAYEDHDVRTLAVQLRYLAESLDAQFPRGMLVREPVGGQDDANLIAAAPEMLAILRRAHEYAVDGWQNHAMGSEMMDAIAKVIAKTTGSSDD